MTSNPFTFISYVYTEEVDSRIIRGNWLCPPIIQEMIWYLYDRRTGNWAQFVRHPYWLSHSASPTTTNFWPSWSFFSHLLSAGITDVSHCGCSCRTWNSCVLGKHTSNWATFPALAWSHGPGAACKLVFKARLDKIWFGFVRTLNWFLHLHVPFERQPQLSLLLGVRSHGWHLYLELL